MSRRRPPGYVYTLVCADAEYTQVNFQFAAPFGIIFDRFAYLQGRPRLFVIDFHRLIQVRAAQMSLTRQCPARAIYCPKPFVFTTQEIPSRVAVILFNFSVKM